MNSATICNDKEIVQMLSTCSRVNIQQKFLKLHTHTDADRQTDVTSLVGTEYAV